MCSPPIVTRQGSIQTFPRPVWTYGIHLWGTASTSIIEILERFQSKALCMIVHAPWYVPNTVARRDLQIPTVKEEICCYSSQYSARLSAHPNDLIVNLIELPDNRRLQRHLPKGSRRVVLTRMFHSFILTLLISSNLSMPIEMCTNLRQAARYNALRFTEVSFLIPHLLGYRLGELIYFMLFT
jgi:hypothetical protein